jgi:hypothetical protein
VLGSGSSGRALLPLGLICLLAALTAAASIQSRAASSPRTWEQAEARCLTVAHRKLAPYPWPLRPFHRQHPIRGYFGDPRTVIFGPGEGLYSFHNGVDISAWPGNRVYPVVSGRVVRVTGDEVVVQALDRRFQYIHVRPWVRPGQWLIASRTVIGTVFRPWNHVHLSELRHGCAVNPLAPGHLVPYVDRTRPRVLAIFFRNAEGVHIPADRLSGDVEAIAEAQDEPAMPAPGVWRRMPVAPALVTWRLSTVRGRVLLHGVAADFLLTEPPSDDFCQVYAPGTVQNLAAESGHFNWGRPGRYLFRLSSLPLYTGALDRGRYLLTVIASDTSGNTGLRTIAVDVRRASPRSMVGPVAVDTRCSRRSLTSGVARP